MLAIERAETHYSVAGDTGLPIDSSPMGKASFGYRAAALQSESGRHLDEQLRM
jgi:hypothetical protein